VETALRVEGLRKAFPGFALDNISFMLPRGAVMGLIGRNGSGKSTTIRVLLGLLHAEAGTVEVLGYPLPAGGVQARERIGFVEDEPGFHGSMKLEAIGRMLAPFYRSWNGDEFRRLLGRLDLDPKRKAGDLSRGQRTRLALAVALAHDAELLVLDEPTSGLDPVVRSEIIDVLHRFIQDERRSVLFSTHITTDLERIADYVTMVDDGRVVFSERADALQERWRVVRGPIAAMDARSRALCVGIRETRFGFEALSDTPGELAARVGPGAVVEKATLEDIMVHTARGSQDA
jgi:ABC-2 type transport system ATP-binding protein